MACHLVALDKRPWVLPVGIGETLCWDLIMRASGDQAKTACGNLQLCTDIEDNIEVVTNAVQQQRLETWRQRQREEEVRRPLKEEETYSVEVGI